MYRTLSPILAPLIALVGLGTGPAPLAAQQLSYGEADAGYGAELELRLARNFGMENNFKRIAGSFASDRLGFAGLQMDISVSKFEETYSTAPSAGAHLYRRLGGGTVVGGFIAGDDLRPGNYFYAGIEAKHQAGPVSLEGYLAHIDVIKSGDSGVRYGLDADFGLDHPGRMGFSAVRAGYHGADLRGQSHGYAYLGTSFDMGRGVSLSAMAGQNDDHETIAGFSASFAIGNGPTFRRRDWYAGLPGNAGP
ncbi:hypothetical protein E0K89_009965 [Aquicoccus sp. SCR17]|nr:hypothetical protein [Carideicomes alvinocaridis]